MCVHSSAKACGLARQGHAQLRSLRPADTSQTLLRTKSEWEVVWFQAPYGDQSVQDPANLGMGTDPRRMCQQSTSGCW